MNTLSDLSLTFLEFVDDIRAGERAFADDINRALSTCSEVVGDDTIATATTLTRTWTPFAGGGSVRIQMTWEARDGWPHLRVESENGAGLVSSMLLKEVELPVLDRAMLKANTVGELVRLWSAAASSVEVWLGNAEVATRFAAIAVLMAGSRRLRDALKPVPASFNQAAGKVGGTETNAHWPAYLQWNDKDPSSGKAIGWVVVYQHTRSGNRPAGLHLVYYNGAGLLPLVGVSAAPSYVGHPILATWTERVGAVVDQRESAESVGSGIVDDVLGMYAGYRKRLQGQATP
jgi:hypothetical protein